MVIRRSRLVGDTSRIFLGDGGQREAKRKENRQGTRAVEGQRRQFGRRDSDGCKGPPESAKFLSCVAGLVCVVTMGCRPQHRGDGQASLPYSWMAEQMKKWMEWGWRRLETTGRLRWPSLGPPCRAVKEGGISVEGRGPGDGSRGPLRCGRQGASGERGGAKQCTSRIQLQWKRSSTQVGSVQMAAMGRWPTEPGCPPKAADSHICRQTGKAGGTGTPAKGGKPPNACEPLAPMPVRKRELASRGGSRGPMASRVWVT